MDKETLSNYGWIVICVLVLAVMIALATPFGDYIKDAVWSTTNGLFAVNENALSAAGITMGNAETGTASGAYIFVNDVHPTTHNLKVNLSSDTITDFSTVNVIRTGKNILNITDFKNSMFAGNVTYDAATNSATFTKTEDHQESYLYVRMWLPEGTYTASANVVASDGTGGSFVVRDTVTLTMINTQTLLSEASTFTITEAQEYEIMIMSAGPCVKDVVTTFSNLQLELGTEKTSFEPYTKQIVKANADGSVSGLTSVSPNMTIIADGDVKINCEYQKKN